MESIGVNVPGNQIYLKPDADGKKVEVFVNGQPLNENKNGVTGNLGWDNMDTPFGTKKLPYTIKQEENGDVVISTPVREYFVYANEWQGNKFLNINERVNEANASLHDYGVRETGLIGDAVMSPDLVQNAPGKGKFWNIPNDIKKYLHSDIFMRSASNLIKFIFQEDGHTEEITTPR